VRRNRPILQVRKGTQHDLGRSAGRPELLLPNRSADHAISWIRSQKTLTPDKPFFIYYASPGTHAPSRVPAAWRDRYKGKFDMGWDKYRDEILAAPGNLRRLRRDIRLRDRPRSHEAKGDLTAYVSISYPFLLSQFAHGFDTPRHKGSKPGVSARKCLKKRQLRWASPKAAIIFW
jgi:hypothetical protein